MKILEKNVGNFRLLKLVKLGDKFGNLQISALMIKFSGKVYSLFCVAFSMSTIFDIKKIN